ncbi:MAG: type I phosphomannose isomerase catalytic subunit [Bacteroidota bacterium]
MNVYPLKFKPILKEKIWGGDKLTQKLHKKSDLTQIGESWEISDVEGDISIVINGGLKDYSLQEVIDQYPNQVLGKSVYQQFGKKFPLLIKFIDAKETLSVQLHPDDKIAAQKHNSFGKTEMWYILESDKDAFIIADFNQKVDKDVYQEKLNQKDITSILNEIKVKEGDCFLIEGGLIHAIGAGTLLAEIQQTSDITYRIYDWDRKDKNGNLRPLHTEDALNAINFDLHKNIKINYKSVTNQPVELVQHQYFNTNLIEINNRFEFDLSKRDSFTILMGVKNNATVYYDDQAYQLNFGETILIPAEIESLRIETDSTSKIVEVSI